MGDFIRLTEVELPHEAVEVVVLEIFRQDLLCKLVGILHNKRITSLQE